MSRTIETGTMNMLQLWMLREGLEFELKGIRLTRKAPSCYSIVKSKLGFKGNKQSVYDQLIDYIASVRPIGASAD